MYVPFPSLIVKAASAVIGALILSWAILKFLPVPLSWIFAAAAALGFWAARQSTAWRQNIILTAASISLALAACELLAAFLLSRWPVIVEAGLTEPDPDLGWRNVASATVHSTRTTNGTKIYDVHYRTDGMGRRLAPPDRGAGIEGCALFFADSFTFGLGVEDVETYPYRVGLRTNGRFRVVNASVGGYGPHHMLVRLESDDFAAGLDCKPTHVFYLAIPHHVLRVANKVLAPGPNYDLNPRGELFRKPILDTKKNRSWASAFVDALLWKSTTYRWYSVREKNVTATPRDLEIYSAVIARAGRIVSERWPGAKLHILAWDMQEAYVGSFEIFLRCLSQTGWAVHDLDRFFPEYKTNPLRYAIHPTDRHPNAYAHDVLAGYIASSILTDKKSAAAP